MNSWIHDRPATDDLGTSGSQASAPVHGTDRRAATALLAGGSRRIREELS
ncbi:hypothetical protein [Streptomyces marianii]|nr:hypothetical protein [Streptomyces marianii]